MMAKAVNRAEKKMKHYMKLFFQRKNTYVCTFREEEMSKFASYYFSVFCQVSD